MPRRKVRKNAKQPVSNNLDQDGVPTDNNEEDFVDHEVERQSAAIRALRDVEIEQLQTMLRLLCSYFSEEQLQVPLLPFFEENFPNLSIPKAGKDGKYEVKWKDREEILSMNNADGRTLHSSFLHRLSMAYPDYSAGIPSMGGFEFSNKTVKTGFFGADKLQIRSLVLEEPSDSQILEPKDSLQTPNVSNNRLSVGITPKTLRLPKCGEVLLSVHGSPLGVYKEDNMETIQETDDG
ncbi:hypothetical protein ABFS82_08G135100 [Erythranthe guttata]|uniref:Uncharacterized protein n=1 Tax=Erythranthe guttata TaxID=4155 RepID=A0A022RTD3_ERYGU|nr:PREDICTED: uncharacterized protein LOC105951425 isoform X2 [Erythranthe guttata]EYU43324.1 hypothetical protein MIMGU_mgv1a012940mg [Erythranthe guttata]|eukprot:XP_012830309.1 PREDICTED: uncharacterized protein LOC105951425 isoform X2 [Erythranthe guttata]